MEENDDDDKKKEETGEAAPVENPGEITKHKDASMGNECAPCHVIQIDQVTQIVSLVKKCCKDFGVGDECTECDDERSEEIKTVASLENQDITQVDNVTQVESVAVGTVARLENKEKDCYIVNCTKRMEAGLGNNCMPCDDKSSRDDLDGVNLIFNYITGAAVDIAFSHDDNQSKELGIVEPSLENECYDCNADRSKEFDCRKLQKATVNNKCTYCEDDQSEKSPVCTSCDYNLSEERLAFSHDDNQSEELGIVEPSLENECYDCNADRSEEFDCRKLQKATVNNKCTYCEDDRSEKSPVCTSCDYNLSKQRVDGVVNQLEDGSEEVVMFVSVPLRNDNLSETAEDDAMDNFIFNCQKFKQAAFGNKCMDCDHNQTTPVEDTDEASCIVNCKKSSDSALETGCTACNDNQSVMVPIVEDYSSMQSDQQDGEEHGDYDDIKFVEKVVLVENKNELTCIVSCTNKDPALGNVCDECDEVSVVDDESLTFAYCTKNWETGIANECTVCHDNKVVGSGTDFTYSANPLEAILEAEKNENLTEDKCCNFNYCKMHAEASVGPDTTDSDITAASCQFSYCRNHKETGSGKEYLELMEKSLLAEVDDCVPPCRIPLSDSSLDGPSPLDEVNPKSMITMKSDCSYTPQPDGTYTSESDDGPVICKHCSEYEKQVQECVQNNNRLSDKCETFNKKLEEYRLKMEMLSKERDSAVKEKEAMVMRYAVSEKNVLEQKSSKDALEKKVKEILRENDILQHKVTQMGSEKARIAQMFDNKCHDLKLNQQELDHTKADLGALETKLKWLQNNLKSEMDARKENEAKMDMLNARLQELMNQLEQAKKEAQESIKAFQMSQENRAYTLDQQLKEQQAILIMLKHEKNDRGQQMKTLQMELHRLQSKQKETLQENNELSLKVQQLERERLGAEQKLSELRCCADLQRQDSADLVSKNSQLEQIRLQLKNEQEQLFACNDQIRLLKQRNSELESDMESCLIKEAGLLLFTQQLTDKNVRLQSEFTSMETKVQQLACEQTKLKRLAKEQQTKAGISSTQLAEDRKKYQEENKKLVEALDEKTAVCNLLTQELADQKGENSVIKRKHELSLRELNKELAHCRRKLQHLENTSSSSSSSSSVDRNGESSPTALIGHVKVVQPERVLDKQALIEHIVKLQRASARKSEKIDFLEEHVNTLVAELQKKSRLLHSYILREQSGALSTNSMDNNKANLAKFHGVMASMYGSRVADNNLTIELSLDINRKLQAVLEDALLENITLKESVDTLGAEIDKLNKVSKPEM